MNFRRGGVLAIMAIPLIATTPARGYGAEVTATMTRDRCEVTGIPIWVEVENVRSASGAIKVELYKNSRDDFLKKRGRISRTRVTARKGGTRACLNAPSPGKFSIAVYHDENGNKKFDRNFLGIPTEGFGFSNNPSLGIGMPDQEDMLFKVGAKPITIRISVIYLWD